MSVAHIVCIDSPSLAPVIDELARVAEANGALHVHRGTNRAPTEYAGAAAVALLAIFEDSQALGAYLDDPDHVAAASRLEGAAVTVVDLERTHS